MKIAKFNRHAGQVYIYDGWEMVCSYLDVVGLRREQGKYLVMTREQRCIGRIEEEVYIKEIWDEL